MLEVQGADVVRQDFCSEAWTGPPDAAFGWWKSRVPEPAAKKIKLAPNDVLLELFDQLADQPDQHDMRYVLTLLLVRRRVLRLDVPPMSRGEAWRRPRSPTTPHESMTRLLPETRRDLRGAGRHAERRNRIDEIQQQLSELLIAGAEQRTASGKLALPSLIAALRCVLPARALPASGRCS